MAKPTEKMLYNVCLDLHFAQQSLDGSIEELTESIKDLKSSKKKIDKNLAIAKENYKSMYGHEPRLTK